MPTSDQKLVVATNPHGSGMTRRGAILAVGVGLHGMALAQAGYPSRPLRMVIPSSPGGTADLLGRLVATRLAESLGQPVVVDNKAGANGAIASEFVARAPADGYTLLVGAIAPIAMAPILIKSTPYDSLKDFEPITLALEASNVLVVHPSVAARNVAELIALARAKPASLSYGSSGNGTAGHLATELAASMEDVQFVHVPYKGGGPMMADLLAGHIQFAFASSTTALPQVASGKLRALAVSTRKRISVMPDVPTMAESGLAGFDASGWACFLAPAGTPAPIVNRLNTEIRRAMNSPEALKLLKAEGLEPSTGTPAELRAFLSAEINKWRQVVRARGITAN